MRFRSSWDRASTSASNACRPAPVPAIRRAGSRLPTPSGRKTGTTPTTIRNSNATWHRFRHSVAVMCRKPIIAKGGLPAIIRLKTRREKREDFLPRRIRRAAMTVYAEKMLTPSGRIQLHFQPFLAYPGIVVQFGRCALEDNLAVAHDV